MAKEGNDPRISMPGYHAGYTSNIPQIAKTYAMRPGGWFDRSWFVRNPQAHGAGYHPQQLAQFKASMNPKRSLQYTPMGRTPNYSVGKRQVSVARPGERYSSWPVLWHEYTHSVDPVLEAQVDRDKMQMVNQAESRFETEMPAMIAEKQVDQSPYVPQHARPPKDTSVYGRQIAKYGPQFTGRVAQDQNRLKHWVNALRRRPGAKVYSQQPFSYSDRRTPQQRATALGNAYRSWMENQPRKGVNKP